MKRLVSLTSIVIVLALTLHVGCGASFAQDPAAKADPAAKTEPIMINGVKRLEKTNDDWKKILPRDAYLVTRMKMTEPAGTGKYAHYKGKGVFACICCGAELFDARNKFESGTGWPSFDRPVTAKNIVTAADNSEAEARVEVICSVCDAHLGHVFEDGPTVTGLRFCINSASLKLVKPVVADPKAKAKTAVKAKAQKATEKTKKDTKADAPTDK
jgi:methionine-R-sulfoxide reductase